MKTTWPKHVQRLNLYLPLQVPIDVHSDLCPIAVANYETKLDGEDLHRDLMRSFRSPLLRNRCALLPQRQGGQTNVLWLRARSVAISASRIGILLGVSTHAPSWCGIHKTKHQKTRDSTLLELSTHMLLGFPTHGTPSPCLFGSFAEETAVQNYELLLVQEGHSNIRFENKGFCFFGDDAIGASPDRIVAYDICTSDASSTGCVSKRRRLVEVKALFPDQSHNSGLIYPPQKLKRPTWQLEWNEIPQNELFLSHDEWESIWDTWNEDVKARSIPPAYWLQVIFAMGCLQLTEDDDDAVTL
jgi:hypothetical protein